MLALLDAAAYKLLEEAPLEGNITHFRSDGVLMAVKKSIPDVGTVPISQDVGSIVFTKEDNLPEDSTLQVVAFVEDPFVWNIEKTEVTSSVVMVTITKQGDQFDASNLQPNITVFVKHRVQFGTTSDTEEQYDDTLPTSYRQNLDDAGRSFPLTKVPSRDTNMKYHAMYIADGGQVPLLRFSVDDVDTELQVYFRFHDFPTEEEYDYTTTVKPPEVTDYDGFEMPFGLVYSNFSTSLIPEISMERGWLMVGVKRKARDVIPAVFTLQTAAVSCLMRENENQTWDNRRCQVGIDTNEETTRCTCDMTPSSDGKSSRVIMAASFLALPNFVEFDKFGSNTDKLSTNSTVFGTIIALWMSHIALSTAVGNSIAVGQAAKLAKAHPSMAIVPKVSTIPSDVPGADYVYVVSVRTGTQSDAGTASVVGLMITGSEGRTAMVTLNPAGLILARGGDTYHIMTTPASIGKLQSVQVWHDSSGKGAMESLFIDNVKVWDLQTSQGCFFPCYTWLSSTKEDGRTIRTLKAADGEMGMSEYTLPTFSYLLYDDHLLLSAVCNSGVRHFSRAQRLVCCLAQTTLWMVGSAMWYGVKLGAQDVTMFDAGVITLRLSELIGTAATSFTVFLPVYVILVPMFRKQPALEDQIPSGVMKMPTSQTTRRFPYKAVAWILAILASVCSSFFVIVYSLQFGAGRSQAWLKDFVLTFLFSTFLLEPVQCFIKLTSLVFCISDSVPARRVLPPAPKKTGHDPNWTERMTTGRNILVLLVFLLIFTGNAFYIGILGFDRHAYHIRTSLENSLLSEYEEVATADDAWEWLSSELIPSLHPERGYSGQKLSWLDKQFPAGTNAFRIGPVRLERTTEYPESPIDIDLETSKQKLYPELMMNLLNGAVGRQNGKNCSSKDSTIIVDEVRNNGSACLTTVDLPRGAGQAAAVVDFLKQTDWILMVSDNLILRANFYHPDVKLFSSVVFRLQSLPGGAAELQPSIQTFRLFQYQTADDYVQMLFHILFVLFYIYNVLNEVWNIRKSGRAYFTSFWNILILCNIGLSTAVIVTFALRYIQAAAALSDIQQAKGLFGINEFVDISTAGRLDTTFKEVLSFSIFISTFSILRVLNFSRGVATIYALPRLLYGQFFGFSLHMLVIIVAYGISGILIFGKNMEIFSGCKKTSYVLFEMGLGRPFVDVFADDMKAVDRVMGPLYYSTFVMVFVFYLMNLGVGMLCNWLSYCQTSDDIGVDTAMGDYFWNSFRSLLGMRHESPQTSDACSDRLGMESGDIPDDSITASSFLGPDYEPYRGRLNGVAGAGAWIAKYTNIGQWLQVFPGNADRNTIVTNLLDNPVDARYVRFVVQSWTWHVTMRVEILGCNTICQVPLGMESGAIPDSDITASSSHPDFAPYQGRLNGVAGYGAWAARGNEIGQWLQVDLGEIKRVTGTVIQGHHTTEHGEQFVTSYKLQYRAAWNSWTTFTSSDGSDKVFTGNTNALSPVTNLLETPVNARYVLFVVQSWHNHISMRVEVLGCNPVPGLAGLTLDDGGIGHLSVSWTVVGSLPISRYRLRYQPADGSGSYRDLSPAPGAGVTSATVSGLLPDRNYTITLTSFGEDDQPNGGINGTYATVKATNDVCVALSSQRHDLAHMYEIVIGGWDNTESAIRRRKQGYLHASALTPEINSNTEYRKFWITWSSDGTIAVGRGGETQPFVQWTDPDPLPITYAGYTTGCGSTGLWKFCQNAVVGSLPISRYRLRYQPADGSGSYRDLSPPPGAGVTSATVPGLLPDTDYILTLTSFGEDDQPNGGINGTYAGEGFLFHHYHRNSGSPLLLLFFAASELFQPDGLCP
uniref:Uncharacterized protein n=1 Tax=Branchiostoma floridae TaxID=7739 RepID=C3ZGF5_BRAFL|eukprot:XP_002592388.1 hypothetical protein BRAFLDRAFT_67253 [Branchiostoma floridae]